MNIYEIYLFTDPELYSNTIGRCYAYWESEKNIPRLALLEWAENEGIDDTRYYTRYGIRKITLIDAQNILTEQQRKTTELQTIIDNQTT